MPTGKKSPSFRLTLQTAFTAVLCVTAFLIRQALEKWLGVELPPFLLLFPVVMFAALLFGLWAGLFATVLSTMLAAVWIFPPTWNFRVQKTSDFIALTLFFAIGVFTSVVADRYRRSLRRLAALESEHALLESRARLHASLASMTEAIFICNGEGNSSISMMLSPPFTNSKTRLNARQRGLNSVLCSSFFRAAASLYQIICGR